MNGSIRPLCWLVEELRRKSAVRLHFIISSLLSSPGPWVIRFPFGAVPYAARAGAHQSSPPASFICLASLNFLSALWPEFDFVSHGERVARGSQAGARSAGRAGHRSMSSLPCRTWPTRTRITHLIPRTRGLMIGKPNINMALGSASSGTPPHFPGAESISSPVCSSAALFASARARSVSYF